MTVVYSIIKPEDHPDRTSMGVFSDAWREYCIQLSKKHHRWGGGALAPVSDVNDDLEKYNAVWYPLNANIIFKTEEDMATWLLKYS